MCNTSKEAGITRWMRNRDRLNTFFAVEAESVACIKVSDPQVLLCDTAVMMILRCPNALG